MVDLIFVAATVLFFLMSLAYVRGCEKMTDKKVRRKGSSSQGLL